jgi:hypothetical protein
MRVSDVSKKYPDVSKMFSDAFQMYPAAGTLPTV